MLFHTAPPAAAPPPSSSRIRPAAAAAHQAFAGTYREKAAIILCLQDDKPRAAHVFIATIGRSAIVSGRPFDYSHAMNMTGFDDDFRKMRRCIVHAQRERQQRRIDASRHFEFLAQAHDLVLIEELSPGRFREFSLGRGTVRTRGLRWQDRCEPLFDWIEARLHRWKRRHGTRLREVRYRKRREDMERRLHPPAFVCHLPSDLFR